LYDILNEAIRERNIPIFFEKRLKTLAQTKQGVIAHFEDGTYAEGDLLIGADGVHSQTRRIILPNGPKPEYVGIISVSGVTPASAVPSMTLPEKQSFNFVYGANGFFGYSGVEHGDLMWWSNLRQPQLSREQLADLSLESIQQQMLALYGSFHEPIPTLIRQMTSPLKLNVHDIQSLPTWRKGRVLLIGDAAHAVSPNSGQGASMAFEDAMYLAKLLRDSADYEQVFARFEQERKPRVEKIVAEGRRRGNDKEAISPLKARMRDLMMTILINLFGIKGQEWVYGYQVAWD
jgi:2-polyprenyl-6-methoxyphenol hydroxylase-like FAD-dependent oxidoreductase